MHFVAGDGSKGHRVNGFEIHPWQEISSNSNMSRTGGRRHRRDHVLAPNAGEWDESAIAWNAGEANPDRGDVQSRDQFTGPVVGTCSRQRRLGSVRSTFGIPTHDDYRRLASPIAFDIHRGRNL